MRATATVYPISFGWRWTRRRGADFGQAHFTAWRATCGASLESLARRGKEEGKGSRLEQRLGLFLLSLTVYCKQERRAMPENRARKHHQDRVAETLRLEIGIMIDGELSDPRIHNCYVSEVALNPGAKSARVYVAVDPAVKDIVQAEKDTVAGLEAAKGYIRYELKERMGVRHVPDLAFLADRSGRFQARIEELMDRSRKRNKYAPQAEPAVEAAAEPVAEPAAEAPAGE
jgi:ribosome-binding factor A